LDEAARVADDSANPNLSGWSFDLLFHNFVLFTGSGTSRTTTTLADRFRRAARRGHDHSRLVTATDGARNTPCEHQQRNNSLHYINLLNTARMQAFMTKQKNG
jgi:hypothetical protein